MSSHTPFALRARVAFPVVAPPVENAVVVIENGHVTQISQREPVGIPVRDLGHAILIPGLVNTHCHLEYSLLKAPLLQPGATLPAWIREVVRRRPSAPQAARAVKAGMAASLDAGVTTVADICRTAIDAYFQPTAPRLILLMEAIGFSQARSASALADAVKRMDEAERLAMEHDSGDDVLIGASPHAPYTVSPTLVRELIATAGQRGGLVAMHLAESPEELELLSEGRGPFQELLEERSMWDPWAIQRGAAPLDYLRMLTKARKGLVVHGNYLDEPSLAMISRHSDAMSLVYCPRTHAYFGHPPYPLETALELGVRVTLGTDSLASSPDLDLLAEMRTVFARHRSVTAEAILRMGTLSGAQSLGLSQLAGSIRPGGPADLTCIPIPEESDGRAWELLTAVLTDEQPAREVWRAGHQVKHAE
ncbi:Aminodeoxyfutalosine deaminase [Pirellulimonas nuda]|uniref:Aminodeoxyfutalosine deaminase n=1 Tax=Pirellulimonas nuda TaxID=2528009 RepID=A0A518DB93_9BACT|nr:amidohydrolase family protein [Pirellulimonas nuda]QDU88706.1 Aminodeoxyfutalosine deaminase [Pirellulimonas nuda]